MNDVDTGALGASGRFARMEAALDRIELKLDQKADATRVAAIEGRIHTLESLFSDLQSGRVTSRISDMNAERLADVEKTVEALEDAAQIRAFEVEARKDRVSSQFRLVATVIGGLSGFSAIASVLALVK